MEEEAAYLVPMFLLILFASSEAAMFEIRNSCNFTVWAASVPVGGGKQLNPDQAWSFSVPAGIGPGRIWARTGCSFDDIGRGKCQTGDCDGVLQCQSNGTPPNTLAEFALNQPNNLDFFDISLVDGFNVPMDFGPATSDGCNNVAESIVNEFEGDNFYVSVGGENGVLGVVGGQFSNSTGCSRGVTCSADVVGECPIALRAPGGCNNACIVFKTDQYCCNSGGSCEPTEFSKFFKDRCPDAYSYPNDDMTSTFTCPGGTNFRVVFCP